MDHTLNKKNQCNTVSIIATIILIGLIFIYLKAFFTVGIQFNDRFIRKYSTESETVYKGNHNEILYQITVKQWGNNRKLISYQITDYLDKHLIIESKYNIGKNREVLIIYNNKQDEIFEAVYDKINKKLLSHEGEKIIYPTYDIKSSNKTPSPIAIDLEQVIQLFYEENLVVQGHMEIFLMAFLLLMITLLDLRFPDLLLPLQNRLKLFPAPELEDASSLKIVSQVICIFFTILLFILSIQY